MLIVVPSALISMAALSLSHSLSLLVALCFFLYFFACHSLCRSLWDLTLYPSLRLSLSLFILSIGLPFTLSLSIMVSERQTDTETERDRSLYSVLLNVVSCLSLVLPALPKHMCNVFVPGQSVPMYSQLFKFSSRALWSRLAVAGCLAFPGKAVTFIG